jgi:DNA-binding response OmpR family regulator
VVKVVLLVEDELKLRELLRSYLEREGLEVLSTGSGAEAVALAHRANPDLVLLDLGLPDVSGEEVIREVRSFSDAPVLVLTAKSAEASRIESFELGADDYVTKPFSPRELILRTKAILGRGRATLDVSSRLSYGNGHLVIDEERHEVWIDDEQVHLTPTEWGLLGALARTPGRVFSRSELINRIRGYEFDGYERTIDSHVKNLRLKVERDPRTPTIIETVLGAGYRLGLSRDLA